MLERPLNQNSGSPESSTTLAEELVPAVIDQSINETWALQILADLAVETDPVEIAHLHGSIVRQLKANPTEISRQTFESALKFVPADKLASVVDSLAAQAPNLFDQTVQIYRRELNPDFKERLYRALLAAVSNYPEIADLVQLEPLDATGLSKTLHIHHNPLSRSERFGLLTDFSLVSKFYLQRVESVKFLPLPARMPRMLPVTENGIADAANMSRQTAAPNGFVSETQFGRSFRFDPENNSAALRHVVVMKQALPGVSPGTPAYNEALSRLRYEAAMMVYLRQHQAYFELESYIPAPSRGLQNRYHVWRLRGLP